MQLKIKRTETGGRYRLDAVVDFSLDERRRIKQYELNNFAINGLSVGELELGKSETYRTLGELLTAEHVIRDACTKLASALEGAGEASGREIVVNIEAEREAKPAPVTNFHGYDIGDMHRSLTSHHRTIMFFYNCFLAVSGVLILTYVLLGSMLWTISSIASNK